MMSSFKETIVGPVVFLCVLSGLAFSDWVEARRYLCLTKSRLQLFHMKRVRHFCYSLLKFTAFDISIRSPADTIGNVQGMQIIACGFLPHTDSVTYTQAYAVRHHSSTHHATSVCVWCRLASILNNLNFSIRNQYTCDPIADSNN